MVMYCSSKCQREDWKRHKVECAHMKSLGLWGLVFDPDEELARYPTLEKRRTKNTKDPPIGPDDFCGICGGKENLELTECCGNVICNKEDDYQLGSFSREFCIRSHRRYTTCGCHFAQGHESADWRECTDCVLTFAPNWDEKGRQERSWYSTNAYNFTPMEEHEYEKGMMITAQCKKCYRRVASGFEDYGFAPVWCPMEGQSKGFRCGKCMMCDGGGHIFAAPK